MAWRRPPPSPLADMPAELDDFDPREWARPGERPDARGHERGDWDATWDYYHAHARYGAALKTWFDAHPDADFLTWINGKRARRHQARTAPQ